VRTWGTLTELWRPRRLEGEACGIPHLAKNERDVGHPATVAGVEPKKRVYSTLRDTRNFLTPAKI
jgi:hypothetical protein